MRSNAVARAGARRSGVTWLPVMGDTREPPRVVRATTTGATYALYGDLRIEMTRAAVRFADERFSVAIDEAIETPHGWIFRAGEIVAASDTFIGPLHRLDVPWTLRTAGHNRGRFAAIDESGVVWTTDGTAPLAHMTGLPDEFAFAVAFADARFGVAFLEPGQLVATHDGGAHWRALDVGADVPVGIELRNDGPVVVLPRGERLVRSDDTLAPRTDAIEEEPERLPDADAARFRTALVARFPSLRTDGSDGRNVPSVPLANGTVMLLETDGPHDELVVFDPHTGREHRTNIELPSQPCSLASWGPNVAIACAGGHVLRCTPSRECAPVASPPAADGGTEFGEGSFVFSDDGRHAIAFRSCAHPATYEAMYSDPGACALRGDGRWTELNRQPGPVAHAAMHGASVLYAMGHGGEPAIDLHVIDIESGTQTRVPARPDAPTRANVHGIHWFDDGHAVVTLDRSPSDSPESARDVTWCDRYHAYPFVLSGSPPDDLAFYPTPRGTIAIDFGTSRSGLASGATLEESWRTTDGGRSWQRIDYAVDGPPANALFRRGIFVDQYARSDPRDVHCDPAGCTIADAVRIDGVGPFDALSPRILAPLRSEECPWRGHGPDESIPDDSIAEWTCTRPGPIRHEAHDEDVTPQRDRMAMWPPEDTDSRTVEIATWDADTVRLDFADAHSRSVSAAVNWQGRDDLGRYSRRASLDAFRVADQDGEIHSVTVEAVSRSGVLLQLCAVNEDPVCAHAWLTVAHGVSRADAYESFSDATGAGTAVIRTLPNGTMLILSIDEHSEPGGLGVIAFGADATVRVMHTFAFQPQTRMGLGTYQGALGVYAVRQGTRHTIRFWPIEPPRENAIELPATNPSIPLRPCTGATRADSALLQMHESHVLFPIPIDGEDARDGSAEMTLEIGARGGSCVRAIQWAVGVEATVGADGTITGVLRGDPGPGFRCTVR